MASISILLELSNFAGVENSRAHDAEFSKGQQSPRCAGDRAGLDHIALRVSSLPET